MVVSYLSHACTIIIIGPYDKAGRELASGIVVTLMHDCTLLILMILS